MMSFDEIIYRLETMKEEDELDDDLSNELVDIYEHGDFEKLKSLAEEKLIRIDIKQTIPCVYYIVDVVLILLSIVLIDIQIAIVLAVLFAIQNNFLLEKTYTIEVQKMRDISCEY